MMSLRPVNSGCGYEYLLRSVATNDASHTESPSLAAYYQAQGTPPGRWLGRGLAGFESERIATGKTIDELQMLALYGEGIHPNADEKIANGEGLNACKIGRGFPVYTNDDPLLVALREAEQAIRIREGRLPTDEEKSELAIGIGTRFFVAENGTEPANGREVIGWVNERKDHVRQAVAGYDFTFSPAKSISVLWALADEKTASKIAACHHRAVAQAMEWAQDEFIRTRSGAGGLRQVKTRGLIAAEFTHFDTRAGDPDLHSHVLVSNKVQDEDGKWKALDGRTIFRFHQAMSFRYDGLVRDELSRTLGVDFDAHSRGDEKEAVWEVSGVPVKALEMFSKRRSMAKDVYDRKVEQYVQRHGSAPGKRMINELWQQAILETRDAKKPAESLANLRQGWMEEVLASDNGQELVNQVHSALETEANTRPLFDAETHVDEAAQRVIETVTKRRNVFRRSHVHTAAAAALSYYKYDSIEHRQVVHDELVNTVLERFGLHLNGGEPLVVPDALRDENGHVVDKLLDHEVYTTAAVLAAEQAVLDAAAEPNAEVLTEAEITRQIEQHSRDNGWSLNAGQAQLARHLLAAGTTVSCGVGPAGTGKTASMRVVADAWKNSGRNVIALAPSAAAADVLSEDLGTDAHTIDSLTFTWNGHHPTVPGGDVSALPVEIKPGDMLLVDEAGMASTANLHALVDIAHAAGAVVRLVGDPQQLDAVENGGLFGALTRATPTAELNQVMRFGDDTEQADASLAVRGGNADGLDLYQRRGWVHGGTREAMLTAAAEDYLRDISVGRRSLVLAATNDDVATLNQIIRTHFIDDGVVDTDQEVNLAAGETAGVGDVILARKNQRFTPDVDGAAGRVINGDLFTVEAIADDGSLHVRNHSSGTPQLLPATYVAEHVHLGYAATVHRAQGATVDVTRAIVDESMSRSGLYVALTRGKAANESYVVCEHSLDPDAEQGHYHYQGDGDVPSPREVLESIVGRDDRERSALETMWDEVDAAESPERRDQLWFFGRDLAIEAFVDAELPGWLARLSEADQAAIAASDDTEAIASAWQALAVAGVDPREHMAAATDQLTGAHDVPRVIAHRLREHLPADYPPGQLPPHSVAVDDDLAAWLRENQPAPPRVPGPTFAEGETVTGQDFTHTDFTDAEITGVTFTDCTFTRADFARSSLKRVTFNNCCVDEATFTQASLSSTAFKRSSMHRVDFDQATFGEPKRTLRKVLFSRCQAQALKFTGAIIHCLEATRSKLPHMDFRGASITTAKFILSDVTGATSDEDTQVLRGVQTKNVTSDKDWPFAKYEPRAWTASPSPDQSEALSADAQMATWKHSNDSGLEL